MAGNSHGHAFGLKCRAECRLFAVEARHASPARWNGRHWRRCESRTPAQRDSRRWRYITRCQPFDCRRM